MVRKDSTDSSPAEGRMDSALAALAAEPFTLHRPVRQRIPFVFASPHSGRFYPADFVEQSRLGALSLRRSEDAFVEELFGPKALALGAPILAARFPRVFLDANRGPGELDPGMFAGRLALPVDGPNPRVQAGLGVIPRVVRDGAEIYRGPLAAAEAEARITHLYRPYHAALLALVEDAHRMFGAAVVIDCHSMPSAAAVPDVILGDRYGTAATALLTQRAQQALEMCGFTVARNVPYAGGFTTQLYGRPGRGVHALQIEINRSLYLDEERIEIAPGFDDVRRRLGEALAHLTAMAPDALLPAAPLPWAAE